ncbi:SDR family NAD(P)-dependent oxidoreductase [Acinetobacter sp. MB5]|uniref:SDR family NAD(P)-dependent oxidoreductase n=1 Tax=Acinetobacter sp. MB5 TaxID=2069438 RepID=UPI000DD0B42F|nr:SDR family NAD(P)-dependent oxidoreductase [Acinetobacter sp. MB5]
MLAIVTGASSGFGYHIAKKLVESGYKVIGVARRIENLNQLHTELGQSFYPLALDLTNSAEKLKEALAAVPQAFQISQIDLLVNNAGLALGLESADKADLEDWYSMVDTNIKGLITMTHLVLPYMVEKKSGLVINIGSIAGSYPYPGGNVYGATKAFVKQFSLNLRADLSGTGVRVCNIEPGLCGGTEFSLVRFKGDAEKVKDLYDHKNPILPEDIANTVAWVAAQPVHININRIEMMPTSQSFNPLKVVEMN